MYYPPVHLVMTFGYIYPRHTVSFPYPARTHCCRQHSFPHGTTRSSVHWEKKAAIQTCNTAFIAHNFNTSSIMWSANGPRQSEIFNEMVCEYFVVHDDLKNKKLLQLLIKVSSMSGLWGYREQDKQNLPLSSKHRLFTGLPQEQKFTDTPVFKAHMMVFDIKKLPSEWAAYRMWSWSYS